MGCLTNIYKYLMWELNITLRLFSVGDQGKSNRWWMLPEIKESHANKWKIFLTIRVVIRQKQIAHIGGGVSIIGDIQSPNGQSWVTTLSNPELWGLTFCPSNSVSSHLARLLITELLWQAPFVGVLVFCSHLSFFYRAFRVTLLCTWLSIANGCFQAFLLKEALCCACYSAWNHLFMLDTTIIFLLTIFIRIILPSNFFLFLFYFPMTYWYQTGHFGFSFFLFPSMLQNTQAQSQNFWVVCFTGYKAR